MPEKLTKKFSGFMAIASEMTFTMHIIALHSMFLLWFWMWIAFLLFLLFYQIDFDCEFFGVSVHCCFNINCIVLQIFRDRQKISKQNFLWCVDWATTWWRWWMGTTCIASDVFNMMDITDENHRLRKNPVALRIVTAIACVMHFTYEIHVWIDSQSWWSLCLS